MATTAAATALPAAADPLCVTCEAPYAVYSCFIDGTDGGAAMPGSHLQCVRELARIGGHASCAVSRQSQGACGGDVVHVPPPVAPAGAAVPAPVVNATVNPPAEARPAGEAGLHDDARVAPIEGDDIAAPADRPKPPRGEPETVKDLAERAVETSTEGLGKAKDVVVDAARTTGRTLEKAGDTAGDIAKKSWRCLTSLFGDC
ncbi:MAG: hypothetical protein NW205_00945 [Hyphomicrobiaceae bacterium]|nr:hypothetical protein [Hyphomicrobiaceae bacterium]